MPLSWANIGAIGIFFQILFAEIPIEEQFGVNI